MKKAYIFDLDGTLLDSMDVWERIDAEFLGKRGFDVPEDYINEICARSFPEAAEYTIRRFGLTETAGEVMREWNSLARHAYGNTVPLKPHAREYLLELKKRGARLGVATGLPEALYEPALRNNGIWELFDAFCSTEETPYGKTRPDVFLLAAKKLGVRPEDCVMFEDIYEAMLSAKAAGMTVIGVYDEYSREHWELICKTAHGAIRDFNHAPLP